jgi:tetratricopeptide (TPR) repeat protein
MRVMLILLWLMLPVLAGIYHLGPGQEKLVLDDAARQLKLARQFAASEEWTQAVKCYERALELAPGERSDDTRRIRLERDKAQMLAKALPQAHQDLKALVDELQAEADADESLLSDARAALANAQYYMTWLMRLEGVPRELWEPEIESSRQLNCLLAESSAAAGDSEAAQRHREDLEASIRLARLDDAELQGLPLPSQ